MKSKEDKAYMLYAIIAGVIIYILIALTGILDLVMDKYAEGKPAGLIILIGSYCAFLLFLYCVKKGWLP